MRHSVDTKSNFSVSAKSSPSGDTFPDVTSADTVVSRRSLRGLLPQAKFFSGQDVTFLSIADDISTAAAGQMVVFSSRQTDSSQFIADAMARGVAGILTEQILPCPLPQCVVGDVDIALANVTSQCLGRPDRQLLTIGVYGSAGKTSTSLLVSQLLRSIGLRTAYQTDLGSSDGIVQSTSSQPIPSATPLIRWLGEAVDTESRTAVIELNEQQAKYGHYDSIEFDLLIVTGGQIDGQDFGPSGLECILERVTAQGAVVASADDPTVLRMIRDSGARTVTYGVRKPADVTAKTIEQECGISTLLVTHDSTTAVMETSLCGAAMAANHAAATAVGILLNQPLCEIVEHLSRLREIPGRMQTIYGDSHANVILDAADTAEQAACALRAARSMKTPGSRLWCVLGVNTSECPSELALIGGFAERFADRPIVTCRTGQKESFLKASHAVLDGVKNCALMRLVADQRRAIEWAISEASPCDTVLILGGTASQNAQTQRAGIDQLKSWVDNAKKNSHACSDPSPSDPEENRWIIPMHGKSRSK